MSMEILLRQLKSTLGWAKNSYSLPRNKCIDRLCKSKYSCVAGLNLKPPLFTCRGSCDNSKKVISIFNHFNLIRRKFSTIHVSSFIGQKWVPKDSTLIHRIICSNKVWLIPLVCHSRTSSFNSMALIHKNMDINVTETHRDASTASMENLPQHEIALMNEAREIFLDAVNSVLPKEMIAKSIAFDYVENRLTIGDRHYHLDNNVYVVGFGKAVLGMAKAVDLLIGHQIIQGVISVPHGIQEEFIKAGKTEMLLFEASKIKVWEGAANNLPDQAAHEAALKIADLVQTVGEGDLLLVLISGGGSALLPAPASPITLSDMLSVTGQMSRGGATITQLNTVRKQLDFLKGGGLASLAYPAQVVSLILSDIVGDPLDLIASGPTVVDTSTPEDCLSIFSQLDIVDSIPQSVSDFLRDKAAKSGEVVENESYGSALAPKSAQLSHVQNVIIGSNRIACQSACEKSTAFGLLPFILSTSLEGEAREVGKMFSHLAVFIAAHLCDKSVDLDRITTLLLSSYKLSEGQLTEIASFANQSKEKEKGVCIVAGGETTVTVTGTGRGGRNQEKAVSAGLEFDKLMKQGFLSGSGVEGNLKPNTPAGGVNVVFLSAGTDGQDGPTPAAGGVVGLHFAHNSEGLEPLKYLDNNDSYSLLKKVAKGSHLVHTGPTGTNVMDIQLLLITPAI